MSGRLSVQYTKSAPAVCHSTIFLRQQFQHTARLKSVRMFWQLVLTAAAVGALYYRWSRRRLYRLAEEVPSGLKSFPIIGHAYKFFGSNEDRMEALQEFGRIANRQCGLSSAWLGHQLFICTTDPNTIEVVSRVCLDKPDFLKFIRMVIGNGSIFAPVNFSNISDTRDQSAAETPRETPTIIVTYTYNIYALKTVNIWHPRRKINAPFFSLKNLNHLVSVFDKKSATMADLMRPEAGRGDFPVWKYFTTFTFDTVCETAVGTKINSQGNPDHVMLRAIDVLSQMLAQRLLQPWLHPDFVYKNLPVYKKFQAEKGGMCDFVDKIIKKKRSETAVMRCKDVNNNAHTNFLDMIIQSSGGSGEGYSDMELREEVLVMVIAGNDTSAVGASFAAVLLSRFPDVQDKVYRELQEVFGDSNRPVTPEDLSRLKYLEAVIKESLRLYPPVPVVTRVVQSDVVLPSGTTLVDGTSVLFNIWGTHRNPLYWGADADMFRPERFLQGPLRHPAQFIPFSYSVRGCIGGTYAMFSAKTALANLVRRYRLLPPAGARAADLTRPLPVKYDIMMKATDDFIVRIEERNKTM